MLFQKRPHELGHFGRVLAGDQARGDFGARPGGNDGFAAFTLITAGEAVNLKCGPRAALLGGRETAFAK